MCDLIYSKGTEAFRTRLMQVFNNPIPTPIKALKDRRMLLNTIKCIYFQLRAFKIFNSEALEYSPGLGQQVYSKESPKTKKHLTGA